MKLARQNLADAGLADLAEIRAGDTLHTLADFAEPIDLVFLDGRNDFYLPVLRLLEAHLSPSALVVADLSADPTFSRTWSSPQSSLWLRLDDRPAR